MRDTAGLEQDHARQEVGAKAFEELEVQVALDLDAVGQGLAARTPQDQGLATADGDGVDEFHHLTVAQLAQHVGFLQDALFLARAVGDLQDDLLAFALGQDGAGHGSPPEMTGNGEAALEGVTGLGFGGSDMGRGIGGEEFRLDGVEVGDEVGDGVEAAIHGRRGGGKHEVIQGVVVVVEDEGGAELVVAGIPRRRLPRTAGHVIMATMARARRRPPLREFQDRGIVWLLESHAHLRGLLLVAAPHIADGLDFPRAELQNRVLVRDDLSKGEADLLYRVPFVDSSDAVWVYVLVEHQSSPDPEMALRMLSHMVGRWVAQRREWRRDGTGAERRLLCPFVPIVFYTGTREWVMPSIETMMRLPEALSDFVPRHKILSLNLREVPQAKLVGSAFAYAMRVLQVDDGPLPQLEQVLAESVKQLEGLADAEYAQWYEAMYYLILFVRHRRPPEEQDRLFSVVTTSTGKHGREVKRMARSAAQALIDQGREQGREQGRGEVQIELLLELLQLKFGPLPQVVPVKLQALPPQRLRELFRKAVSAQALADLDLDT